MRKSIVYKAVAEAERLLEAVKVMERAAGWRDIGTESYFISGQFTASVRRASMDLTKALADLRRG